MLFFCYMTSEKPNATAKVVNKKMGAAAAAVEGVQATSREYSTLPKGEQFSGSTYEPSDSQKAV